MKLLVGLGNPGPQYTKTRHNVGFMVVDRLLAAHAPTDTPKGRFGGLCVESPASGFSGMKAKSDEGDGGKTVLLKPTTFMNRSGSSVAEAVRFYKLVPSSDVLVIVDDLYLPVGTIKLKPEGGAGGHNGLSDIERVLGTQSYPRLRIGVGLKPSGGKPPFMDQADFVLSRFSDEEWDDLTPALDRSAKAAEAFVVKGLAAAMNAFNAPDTPVSPKPKVKPKPEGASQQEKSEPVNPQAPRTPGEDPSAV